MIAWRLYIVSIALVSACLWLFSENRALVTVMVVVMAYLMVVLLIEVIYAGRSKRGLDEGADAESTSS